MRKFGVYGWVNGLFFFVERRGEFLFYYFGMWMLKVFVIGFDVMV